MKDKGFRMKDSSCLGVSMTDRQLDICDCRVAFATEKLKSFKVKKLKDEDEGGGEGADFKLFEGFYFLEDRWMNKQTDICECRVAFTTENKIFYYSYDCRDLSSYIE